MKHVLDMMLAELSAEINSLGQPEFRAKQVAQWAWSKGVADFASMTNLPAALRGRLGERMTVLTGKVVRRSDATDGVIKLLIEWPDGQSVEMVMIPAENRRTACVSTQAGCGMGCTFCASGLYGVARNLTAGEIVEQILQLQRTCGERISHVVLMGMGEPLANYDATVSAIRAMIDPHRLGLSARHITLSTVGLPDQIRRLAEEDIPLTLAISLHAPNDRLRCQLIPAAKGATIAELIAAGQEFFAHRGRELTLEYILLSDVNDTPQCADELADIAGQLRCNVNLIRYNPVPGLEFRRPAEERVIAFRDRLEQAGVNVQIRASRGLQAQAACGQLRRAATTEPHRSTPDGQ